MNAKQFQVAKQAALDAQRQLMILETEVALWEAECEREYQDFLDSLDVQQDR